MRGHYLTADGESQPHPAPRDALPALGLEEPIEDLLPFVLRDPGAVVTDRDHDCAAGRMPGHAIPVLCRDLGGASVVSGHLDPYHTWARGKLDRILQQVDEDAADVHPVADHAQGGVGHTELELDSLLVAGREDLLGGTADEVDEIGRPRLEWDGAGLEGGELEGLGYHRREPFATLVVEPQ